jgi:hypothetical protein
MGHNDEFRYYPARLRRSAAEIFHADTIFKYSFSLSVPSGDYSLEFALPDRGGAAIRGLQDDAIFADNPSDIPARAKTNRVKVAILKQVQTRAFLHDASQPGLALVTAAVKRINPKPPYARSRA